MAGDDAATGDEESDTMLLARGSKGDERAIRSLVSRHIRAATLLAAQLLGDRDEAEDVVQEAFLVVVRRAAEFDSGSPFAPWLFGVVRRLALKARARTVRRWRLLHRWRTSDDAVVEASAPAEVDASTIRAALRALPPMQRACCELALVHGLSADEISRMHDVAPSTVRQHIFRGRQRLRALLADDTVRTEEG